MRISILTALTGLLLLSWKTGADTWMTEKQNTFTLLYKEADKNNIAEYLPYLNTGMKSVSRFFSEEYRHSFDVYIHPERKSMETQWQKDWNMPDFKSECWMVASGTAKKLDLLSPKQWGKEACEHIYSETEKTQGLITHELAHVFHGQHNASPDFSNIEGIDWFVEGLATYASGQCDSLRMEQVRIALQENKIPGSLDQFWTGKLKYGLSGSMVMYIDSLFGRKKLIGLLAFSKKSEILSSLNITEAELMGGWKKFVNNS